MQKLRLRPQLIVHLLLPVVIVISFDGLLLKLGSQIGGTPDLAARSLWHLWWPQFSLRQADFLSINAFSSAPYLSNHITYLPIVPSMLFGVLQLTGNPLLAFNIILLLSFIATYYAVYQFLIHKELPHALASLATLAFVLSAWYQGRLAEPDVIGVGLWPMPLALLAWDLWRSKPTTRRAALVVVVLYGAVLNGVQHISWILVLWLPYAFWTTRHHWQTDAGELPELTTAARDQAAAMSVLLGILLFVYPAPNLVRTLQGNEPAFAPLEGAVRSTSLLGAILRAGPAIWLYTGAVLVVTKPARRLSFWLAIGGLSLVFAVGLLPEPLRMLTGALGLPYQPLYETHVFFAPALFACLTFCCLGSQSLWREWTLQRSAWTLGLGAAIIALALASNPSLVRPYRTQEVPSPSFYKMIASEPEDYVVLSYPFGLANTADDESLGEGAFLSQYAMWHHKRTVSGVGPYYEPAIYDDLASMPFLHPEALTDEDSPKAAEALSVAVGQWRIGYVVGHEQYLTQDELTAIDALADQSGSLCPGVEREGLVIYRALWHPFGCTLE